MGGFPSQGGGIPGMDRSVLESVTGPGVGITLPGQRRLTLAALPLREVQPLQGLFEHALREHT